MITLTAYDDQDNHGEASVIVIVLLPTKIYLPALQK